MKPSFLSHRYSLKDCYRGKFSVEKVNLRSDAVLFSRQKNLKKKKSLNNFKTSRPEQSPVIGIN